MNIRQRILHEARAHIGTPYSWYRSPAEVQHPERGLNCYGFARFVLSQSGLYVPAGLFEMWDGTKPTNDPQDADFVFFNGRGDGLPGHVGFYTREGTVIHCAKEFKGVVETPLSGYKPVMGYRCLFE